MKRICFGIGAMGLGLLLISAVRAQSPLSQPTWGPDWQIFSQRLEALRKNPPKDEHVAIWHYSGGYKRHVLLWARASPASRRDGTWMRKLTVFVDDLSGHRVRTVPGEVVLEVKPPARVMGSPRAVTVNGEATFELSYGPGQQTISATAMSVPPIAVTPLNLPLGSVGSYVRKARHVDEDTLSDHQKVAQQNVVNGQPEWASRELFSRAEAILLKGQYQRAADAFADCEATYPNSRWAVLCAYGQIQALREAGQAARAEQLADRLLKQYPTSVPAQFLKKQPGEIWYVPYFGLPPL